MNALKNQNHLSLSYFPKTNIHHHALFFCLGVISLIWVSAMLAMVFLYQKPVKQEPEVFSANITKPATKPTVFYSPLTGLQVPNQEATKQTVTGVMIENSPDARPQSGLKEAGIVYEAIAEGGITRFLALYQESKPQLIGPVRSLRMYYVDWLAAYNASVAHVGGSAAALTEIRNGTYRDIDQFFNAGSYWRSTDRYAPHNVYTNFEKLDALNKAKGYTNSNFVSWPRADGKTSPSINASNIDMIISGPQYNVHYTFDAPSNSYIRSQAGAPHLDREKGQIQPSVVIGLKVNMAKVMEDGYRESIQTTGSGEAVIFQNGTAIKAKWLKNDRHSPLRLVDATDKEIPLNRGQVWLTAIANSGGGLSWQ